MNVQIDWNNIPNHAQYVAADSNGTWYWFINKPRFFDNDRWISEVPHPVSSGECGIVDSAFVTVDGPIKNPAQSLFSRPVDPTPNQLLTYRAVVQAMLNGERVVRIDPHDIESSVEVKNFYIDVDKLDRKPDFDYFIKQATIVIGDIEVPKPVQDVSEMEEGDTYFIPVLGKSSMFDVVVWTAKDYDMSNLTRGLVHKTRVGAVIHAMALIKVSGGMEGW